MGLSTKASDWKVSFRDTASALSFTVLRFKFFSKTADVSTTFIFAGREVTPGIIMGGDGLNPTSIQCIKAFSADELNWTPGVVFGLGSGLIVGNGILFITAGSLFANQQIPGTKLAIGIKVFTAVGLWKQQ